MYCIQVVFKILFIGHDSEIFKKKQDHLNRSRLNMLKVES